MSESSNHKPSHKPALRRYWLCVGCVCACLALIVPSLAAAIDSDNDGLDDAIEGTDDLDNDAIPNDLDPDADGDGQPDRAEGLLDFDNDGLPGYLDTDDDGDGIPTLTEGPPPNAQGLLRHPHDLDRDGIPNHLDLDSDNDGLLDSEERLGDDDDDGILNYLDADDADGSEGDADQDGLTNRIERLRGLNPLLADSDQDGLSDIKELSPSPAFDAIDTDGDGILDALDPDDDDDGIPTAQEIEDANGFVNGKDFDSDGTLNWLDRDSDGDSINDAIEGSQDSDGGGSPNDLDLDADGDERLDAIEGQADDDQDGVPNFLDPLDADGPDADADQDGLSNAAEVALGLNPHDPDSDQDGLCDGAISVESRCIAGEFAASDQDSDGDKIIDALDPDDDNDSILTAIEVFYGVAFGNADPDNDLLPNHLDPDSDGDGHFDAFESAGDFDQDGLPNYLDLDSDFDGINDADEPFDDSDQDGAFNLFDPVEDGPDADDDGDSITNLHEALIGTDPHLTDSDGDSLDDASEVGPQIFNPLNSDQDDFINALDPDDDNDSIPTLTEVEDESLALRALQAIALDSDDIPAHLDTNSDDDTPLDIVEGEKPTQNCSPFDPALPDVLFCLPAYLDTDDIFSTTIDWDTDGIPNALETPLGTDPRNPDSDGDGLCDGLVSVAVEVPGFVTADEFCIAGEDAQSSQNTDGDRFIDALDDDDDNDTILTATEVADTANHPSIGPDPDNDGLPNWRDDNADGDFELDAEEPGDANANGIPDYLERPSSPPEDVTPEDVLSVDTSPDTAADAWTLQGGCGCASVTSRASGPFAPVGSMGAVGSVALAALLAFVLRRPRNGRKINAQNTKHP